MKYAPLLTMNNTHIPEEGKTIGVRLRTTTFAWRLLRCRRKMLQQTGELKGYDYARALLDFERGGEGGVFRSPRA